MSASNATSIAASAEFLRTRRRDVNARHGALLSQASARCEHPPARRSPACGAVASLIGRVIKNNNNIKVLQYH